MDEPSKPIGTPAQQPSAIDEGKEQVRRLGEAVRDRAMKSSEQRRGQIVDRIGKIAERLEEVAAPDGGESNQYVERAAGYVRRLERTLDQHSTEELLSMAEERIRERPGLFLAGCFALGFGAARLLRK